MAVDGDLIDLVAGCGRAVAGGGGGSGGSGRHNVSRHFGRIMRILEERVSMKKGGRGKGKKKSREEESGEGV